MSRKIIARYCKEVGRLLICLPETRQALLKGLQTELKELPLEYTESHDKLEAHYGKLPQTVLDLQEAVSAGERAIALKQQHRRYLLIGIIAAALILLLVVFIVLLRYEKPWIIFVGSPIYN